MSYIDFTLEKVRDELGLKINGGTVFPSFPPLPDIPINNFTSDFFNAGLSVSRVSGTDKALSEFIASPLLIELKLYKPSINVFSGVELNVDRSKGLYGNCDFLITYNSSCPYILTAPITAVISVTSGNMNDKLHQCIAQMYAAQIFNQSNQGSQSNQSGQKTESKIVYGVVVTAIDWVFLKLEGKNITIDSSKYSDVSLLLPRLLFISENKNDQ